MHSKASTPTNGQQVYPHQTHSLSCRTSRQLSTLRLRACSHRWSAPNDKSDASKLCIEQGRNAIGSVTLACILFLSQPCQAVALPDEPIQQYQQLEQVRAHEVEQNVAMCSTLCISSHIGPSYNGQMTVGLTIPNIVLTHLFKPLVCIGKQCHSRVSWVFHK
jgi:hypothetical protein